MCMAKVTGKNLITCQNFKVVSAPSPWYAGPLVYLGLDEYFMADFLKTFFFPFCRHRSIGLGTRIPACHPQL